MSIDRKTTVYEIEACELFSEERIPAVHSNVFPYFADLSVSLSLYRRYSTRAGIHNSVNTVQAFCDTLVQ